MLIGEGEQHEWLYYFRGLESAKTFKVFGVNGVELWNKRLGHPSDKITRMLLLSDNSGINCVESCDICLRAKQCRSEFQSSGNKASKIFYLIHCDL